MKFQFNDGGRTLAGYKGKAGDCVCRAIAIAAEMPYEEVYQRLASGTGSQRLTKKTRTRERSARNGIHTSRKWFKDFMTQLGFKWTPCMSIGSGCKVHLTDGELPMGRLIAVVSRHWTAVIDGVINDTYSPERNLTVITGTAAWPSRGIAGTQSISVRRRCVYGYWSL